MKKQVKLMEVLVLLSALLLGILIFNSSQFKIQFSPEQVEYLTVTRDLPDNYNLDEQFNVVLHVKLNESKKIIALGIIEQIPQGWEIFNLTYGYFKFDEASSTAQWFFFSLTGDIEEQDIIYGVIPKSDIGNFNGTFLLVDSDGADYEGVVEGDLTTKKYSSSGNHGGNDGGGSGAGGGGGGSYNIKNTTNESSLTCLEKWVCNTWSECKDEKQERICNDVNNCSKEARTESLQCSNTRNNVKDKGSYTVILSLIVLIIITLVIIVIISMRNRKGKRRR